MQSGAPTAFFSYSREDSEFALRLASDLKAAGANVWLDQLDIPAGQSWARAVEEALNRAAHVLVILSPASVDSRNVESEISFALDERKTVIPVLYRDCKLPLRLHALHYVDFRTDYERGLKIVLKALGVAQESAARAAAVTRPAPQVQTVLATYDRPKQALEDEGAREPAEHTLEAPLTNQYPHAGVSVAWSRRGKILLACGALVVFAIAWYLGFVRRQGANPMPGANDILSSNPLPRDAGPQLMDLYRRAKEGDTQAMVQLGFAFENGNGVPKDLPKSAALFRKAADAGNAQAMTEYGWSLKNGFGVEQNFVEAVTWFRKSAEAGNSFGMDNLGVMYRDGNGVERDDDQAFLWLRKGAQAGNFDAMGNLGWMYLNGLGTDKDYKQAEFWSRKAADANYAVGMANLGGMYENGQGVQQNLQQAVDWYQKAACRGNEFAQKALKRLALKGEGGGWPSLLPCPHE